MKRIQILVDDALDAAVFEGDFHSYMTNTAREVAQDLCAYVPNFENLDVDDVVPCVKDYMAWYRGEKRQ